MLVSKLLDGVVVVEHGTSRRAFRPKFLHRLMLVWIFRYFTALPMPVLSGWQRSLIIMVMTQGAIIPLPSRESGIIIGTVENAASPPVTDAPLPAIGDWDYAPRRASADRISA
jgi:hypothetical protein